MEPFQLSRNKGKTVVVVNCRRRRQTAFSEPGIKLPLLDIVYSQVCDIIRTLKYVPYVRWVGFVLGILLLYSVIAFVTSSRHLL